MSPTMYATEVRQHLMLLGEERVLAHEAGLDHDRAYMADLEDEIEQYRSAYIQPPPPYSAPPAPAPPLPRARPAAPPPGSPTAARRPGVNATGSVVSPCAQDDGNRSGSPSSVTNSTSARAPSARRCRLTAA